MSQHTVVVCDRCAYTLRLDEKHVELVLPIADDFEPGELSFSKLDLCPQCTTQLISWTTATQEMRNKVTVPTLK